MGLKDIIYDLFTEKIPEQSIRVEYERREDLGKNVFLMHRYDTNMKKYLDPITIHAFSPEFCEVVSEIQEKNYSER